LILLGFARKLQILYGEKLHCKWTRHLQQCKETLLLRRNSLVRLIYKNVITKICTTEIYLLFYMDTKLGLSHTERSQSTYLRTWCNEII
jgi:hypothetical protein